MFVEPLMLPKELPATKKRKAAPRRRVMKARPAIKRGHGARTAAPR